MAAMKLDLAAGWMVNRVAPSCKTCLCAAASHFLHPPPFSLCPVSLFHRVRVYLRAGLPIAAARLYSDTSSSNHSPFAFCFFASFVRACVYLRPKREARFTEVQFFNSLADECVSSICCCIRINYYNVTARLFNC